MFANKYTLNYAGDKFRFSSFWWDERHLGNSGSN